ncbi:efflux RND transporter periplasmic adaptor subunit [Siccibacter turicensis]|uniref:efflux RND transporter periplasmic adaptor subunit n=1 Tax=Siccibacter turicensis TaxID=357233 RepID=UPI002A6B782B|nr:efflux RND transporter periplasmic adaptor subunit [Siccibacter turicensis]MDY0971223.1 efflux RND transporter periplasmic adaptor subunit [Siccibacter turicensis]
MTKQVRAFSCPLLVCILTALLSGCNDDGDKNSQPSLPQVTVHAVVETPLPITTELPGRTVAYRIAEVRPQVSGVILKRNFVEGSEIEAGSSLYQIDPATYQADVESAKGNLAKAEASATIAHLTLKRYAALQGTNYVSKQDYDQAAANARQADASVLAARAALDAARINLAYTKVLSPISGRIGKSSVTEGALVQQGQSAPLATVQQLDPIYVDVTQSSNDYLRLKAQFQQGSLQRSGEKSRVTLVMDDGKTASGQGTLEFSDVTVDESTGSITLRAIFPNPDHTLLPGMFVRARIENGIQPNAILVPQQGVTRTPRGEAVVMLINAQDVVESRVVEASEAVGNDWLVTAGLKPGDRVVTSGLQKIRAGVKVHATLDTAPQPAQ